MILACVFVLSSCIIGTGMPDLSDYLVAFGSTYSGKSRTSISRGGRSYIDISIRKNSGDTSDYKASISMRSPVYGVSISNGSENFFLGSSSDRDLSLSSSSGTLFNYSSTYYYLSIDVASTVPIGTIIPLKVEISKRRGSSASDTYTWDLVVR